MKNANKNTQKGVDAESKEGAGRDWLANFSQKKPSFFKIWTNPYLSEESSWNKETYYLFY